MKRLFCLAVAIFCALVSNLYPTLIASATVELSYAIIGQNALLYRKTNTQFAPVTTLPPSYFVAIIGEEENGYLRVSYLDIDGYMLASDLTAVDYTPKFKYAENTALTVSNDGHLVNFRATPTSSGKVLATVNSGNSLYYYGQVAGEVSNEFIGDTWYYARFVSSDGTCLYGYIYSLYAHASPIPPNEIVAQTPPSEAVLPSVSASGFTSAQTREIVIIVSLCLPVLAISYLIFRNEKRL